MTTPVGEAEAADPNGNDAATLAEIRLAMKAHNRHRSRDNDEERYLLRMSESMRRDGDAANSGHASATHLIVDLLSSHRRHALIRQKSPRRAAETSLLGRLAPPLLRGHIDTIELLNADFGRTIKAVDKLIAKGGGVNPGGQDKFLKNYFKRPEE